MANGYVIVKQKNAVIYSIRKNGVCSVDKTVADQNHKLTLRALTVT